MNIRNIKEMGKNCMFLINVIIKSLLHPQPVKTKLNFSPSIVAPKGITGYAFFDEKCNIN